MAIKSKKVKLDARTKSKFRIRKKAVGTPERPRITVFKSSKHTYAQAISDLTGKTVASASTLEKDVMGEVAKIAGTSGKESKEGTATARNDLKSTKSVNAARAVGIVLARRMLEQKVSGVVFDRNGFIYSGRIQAVADGAREGGLQF